MNLSMVRLTVVVLLLVLAAQVDASLAQTTGSITPHDGCGFNPNDSLIVWEGNPSTDATVTLAIDNPLGTQTPGSTFGFLGIHGAPPPAGCILLPGFGMAGTGALGELLLPTFSPHLVVSAGTWEGTGQPALAPVAIPDVPALVGVTFACQGLLVDLAAGSTAPFGLSSGLSLTVGPPCVPASSSVAVPLPADLASIMQNSLVVAPWDATFAGAGWALDYAQGVEIFYSNVTIPNPAPLDARYAMIPVVDGSGLFQGLFGFTVSESEFREGAEFTQVLDSFTLRTYTVPDLSGWFDLAFSWDTNQNCDPATSVTIVMPSTIESPQEYLTCLATFVLDLLINDPTAIGITSACIDACKLAAFGGAGLAPCLGCAVLAAAVLFAGWWNC
jgi:hypothetical protein